MIGKIEDHGIDLAASIIKNARHVVAFTGAGISTPSGVPDFRSSGSGLWEHDDPIKVASLSSFHSHPEIFFNWLKPLARSIWMASPNPAHHVLASFEESDHLHAVITQNIDSLHQKAGSKLVFEVHGSLETLSCQRCRQNFPSMPFRQLFLDQGELPRCPKCNTLLKPGIVLFEEMLPEQVWYNARQECEKADVILIIGSSLEVSPANQLPIYGLNQGASLIIINYTTTFLDRDADVVIHANAARVLPQIAGLI